MTRHVHFLRDQFGIKAQMPVDMAMGRMTRMLDLSLTKASSVWAASEPS